MGRENLESHSTRLIRSHVLYRSFPFSSTDAMQPMQPKHYFRLSRSESQGSYRGKMGAFAWPAAATLGFQVLTAALTVSSFAVLLSIQLRIESSDEVCSAAGVARPLAISRK